MQTNAIMKSHSFEKLAMTAGRLLQNAADVFSAIHLTPEAWKLIIE
jgi:hypothetical protein